jgi:hypothetical protein
VTSWTVLAQLARLYHACPDQDMWRDMAMLYEHGHIFEGEHFLVGGFHYANARGHDDGWFVHVAIGRHSLQRFVRLMPYYLPYVGWKRMAKGRDQTHWYPTESLLRRVGLTLNDIGKI